MFDTPLGIVVRKTRIPSPILDELLPPKQPQPEPKPRTVGGAR